jgi:hypothetical protein
VHNVIGTKYIVSVGAEGLEEDFPMLRWGGGQDVPSSEAAAKQQRISSDISLYNGKIKDWSRFHNSSFF